MPDLAEMCEMAMREAAMDQLRKHIPNVCTSCQKPIGNDSDTCSFCGRKTPQVIVGCDDQTKPGREILAPAQAA